jgi:uncharacterized protein YqgV (UPF0045/DUF77 family)
MSDEIAEAVQVIRDSGLDHEVGPTGTTIFGEFGEVMDVIEECHERVAEDGTRVNSELMIDAKPGLEPGEMRDRVDRVMQRVEEGPPAL